MDLLIIATNRDAAASLKQDLNQVLHHLIDIEIYQFTENSYCELGFLLREKPRLIISTRQFIIEHIRKEYPEFEVIEARRDLYAPQKLDRLFQILPGTRVPVVNETRSGAMETISALKQLGVTHLQFFPYWDGCNADLSACRYAVTPAMAEYYPDSSVEMIDVGMRWLSAATFMKILNVFHLDYRHLDLYVLHSRRVLTDTYKRLGTELNHSHELEQSLNAVLDQLDFALLVFNREKKITKFNFYADKIFSQHLGDLSGLSVDECIRLFCKNTDTELPEHIDGVFALDGKQYYVDCILMREEDSDAGMLRFRDITEIRQREEHIRQQTYRQNLGHAARYHFEDMVSESSVMDEIIRRCRRFAASDTTVLITGESGTGKELFAQSIHNASPRRQGPFVAVNFAALPENLVESELFGYEDGAFTGAKKSGKKGIFELAHGGTVFLDEIGDASPWVQMRLLRVLEEKVIMRLGDTKVVPVDVRVIAATNKNLEKLIQEEKFREDLYYRLNILQVQIPPLRDRKEEILPLFQTMLRLKGAEKTLTAEVEQILLTYSWKGNVRELRNTAEYVFIMSQEKQLQVSDLPVDIRNMKEVDVRQKKENEQEEVFGKISARLKILYPDSDIMKLLQLLFEAEGLVSMGRKTIAGALRDSQVLNSEAQVRKALTILDEMGLVSVGKTRQGTHLTEKGKEYYLSVIQQ